MSITYPTFADKEIVSSEKLNAFVQAIEAKFTAGLGTADISWPLTADGDLNMVDNEITGATKIMGIVHAGSPQYADFDAAMTAGASGIVFIPPNTTLRVDGAALAGTSIAIVGAGPSSVLKLTDSPTAGYMLRNTTANADVLIANLTLDGNDGASSDGLVLRDVKSAILHSVWFKNWSQSALYITYLSGSANYSRNVRVTDCSFEDGSGNHILCDSAVDVIVKGCISEGCDTKAFEFVAADGTARMLRISILDNNFKTCDEEQIRVLGASGTPSAFWSDIIIQGNHCYGDSGTTSDLIVVGGPSAIIEGLNVSDNVLVNCIADGIYISGNDGIVSANVVESCGSDAIELEDCKRIKVCDNMLANATHYAIKLDNADQCQVHDNDVSDAGTGGVQLASTNATFTQYNNEGMVGIPPANCYMDAAYNAITSDTDTNIITIPANMLKAGCVLRLVSKAIQSGAAGDGYMRLRINDGVAETTVAAGTTFGAGGEIHLAADVLISSATHFKGIGVAIPENANKIKRLTDTSVDVDLTTAITCYVTPVPTAGDTITTKGLVVTIFQAEIQ